MLTLRDAQPPLAAGLPRAGCRHRRRGAGDVRQIRPYHRRDAGRLPRADFRGNRRRNARPRRILNYTAERLVQVWPSRFPTAASAAPYAHNPKALADIVYGGRGGNVAGTDDGWSYPRPRADPGDVSRQLRRSRPGRPASTASSIPDLLTDPAHAIEFAALVLEARQSLARSPTSGNFQLRDPAAERRLHQSRHAPRLARDLARRARPGMS